MSRQPRLTTLRLLSRLDSLSRSPPAAADVQLFASAPPPRAEQGGRVGGRGVVAHHSARETHTNNGQRGKRAEPSREKNRAISKALSKSKLGATETIIHESAPHNSTSNTKLS